MTKKDNKKIVFYGLLVLDFILSFVLLLHKEGSLWNNMLFSDSTDTFMDFFKSVECAIGRRPYEAGCIYPPLTYLIYWFVYKMIPFEVRSLGAEGMRSSQSGIFILVSYTVLLLLAIAYVLYRNKQGKELEKVGFTLLMLFSTPVIFAVERGNIILISVLFLMIFLYEKDSEVKWKRELAYVSLAIAVAIKIYPVIFGILLILEKRWKDAWKCIGYGILVFFGPFVFFGGFSEVGVMLRNIFSTTDIFATVRYGFRVNFTNTWNAFSYFTGGNWSEELGKVLLIMLVIVGAVAVILEKTNWRKIALLTTFMVALPSYSCTYVLSFFIAPCAMLLDTTEKKKTDWIYLICFVFMFALVPVNLLAYFPKTLEGWPYTLGTCLESLAILVLFVGIIVEAFAGKIRAIGKGRNEGSV